MASKKLKFSEPFVPLGAKSTPTKKRMEFAPTIPLEGKSAPTKKLMEFAPTIRSFVDPDTRVLQEYLKLAGNYDEEVRLADLRRNLPDVSSYDVDEALRKLRFQKRLVPYPIENARELKPEDVAAALTLGITNHHYIRVKE